MQNKDNKHHNNSFSDTIVIYLRTNDDQQLETQFKNNQWKIDRIAEISHIIKDVQICPESICHNNYINHFLHNKVKAMNSDIMT